MRTEPTTHVHVTQVSRLMDKLVSMLMSVRNYLAETESVPMRLDLTGQIFEKFTSKTTIYSNGYQKIKIGFVFYRSV